MIPVLGSFAIAVGYSVVVGWFLRFLWGAVTGGLMKTTDTAAYFGEIAGNFGSVGWHFLGLGITFLIRFSEFPKGLKK